MPRHQTQLRTKTKRSSKGKAADIVQIIVKDHKPLKALIKTMKANQSSYEEKKKAFETFAPTLNAHAKPEEQSWYKDLKSKEKLRTRGLEGDIEHELADQLCEELKRTTDEDLFQAKVKVLAELVEHHIEEEETHMLPSFKKSSSAEERASIGAHYLKLQNAVLAEGADDAPREKGAGFKQREARMN